MLELTDDQQAAAQENYERLVRWSSAVASFLRRRGAGGDAEIEQLATDVGPCVRLRWRDRDDVPERQWRTKLHREMLRVSAEVRRRLAPCAAEQERAVPVDAKPFVPLRLSIEALARNRYLVSASETIAETIRLPENPVFQPSPDRLEAVGRGLFEIVFSGSVGEAFRNVRRSGNVRIEVDSGRGGVLHSAPWELLHDGDQFLALSSGVSIARHLPGNRSTVREPPQTSLRLLMMASSPADVTFLDVEAESVALEAALAPLTMLGLLEIDFVSDSSLNALRRRLRNAADAGRPHHVLHFIGHGYGNSLVMSDDGGRSRDVTAAELELLFDEHRSLALVVLNSCEGIRFNRDGSTGGASVAFLERGAPDVVAMQASISDSAAILFSEELYGGLSDGASLDRALNEARRALFFQKSRDWFFPVLVTVGK